MLSSCCLIVGLFWISVCWGQNPILTLDQFEDVCLVHGKDTIQTKGTLNMNGADPADFNKIVNIIDGDKKKMDQWPFDDCATLVLPTACTKINNSYFILEYEAKANKALSQHFIRLRILKKTSQPFVSPPLVQYPVVKDSIEEMLEVKDTVVPLDNDTVTVNITGFVTVSYIVKKVLQEKLTSIHILDSSYNVLAQSSSNSEVSTDLQADDETIIYVSYNTTNGCFSGTEGHIKVVFIGNDHPLHRPTRVWQYVIFAVGLAVLVLTLSLRARRMKC